MKKTQSDDRRSDIEKAWEKFKNLGTGAANKAKKALSAETRKKREEKYGL